MDIIGYLVLAVAWLVVWSTLFASARSGHGKPEYNHRPNGPVKDYSLEMRFYSRMALLAPMWPIAFLCWLGWWGVGFLADLVSTALEMED
jgi:hypothetical protein